MAGRFCPPPAWSSCRRIQRRACPIRRCCPLRWQNSRVLRNPKSAPLSIRRESQCSHTDRRWCLVQSSWSGRPGGWALVRRSKSTVSELSRDGSPCEYTDSQNAASCIAQNNRHPSGLESFKSNLKAISSEESFPAFSFSVVMVGVSFGDHTCRDRQRPKHAEPRFREDREFRLDQAMGVKHPD